MNGHKTRHPGDLILDRYMPNATPEQREEARANLKAYLAVVLQKTQRLAREAGEKQIREMNGVEVNSEAQP